MSDLIPPSLIPLELIPPGINDRRSREFARALEQLLAGFSTSAVLVQNPMTVDARLLPSMVISLAMTDFVPSGLNEPALRRLLAAAPEIHKWTGTVKGARMALQAIGVKVVWKQWYQQSPKAAHDTHIVTAYVNEQLFDDEANLLSARTQKAVLKQLEATQRWSQHISFQIGVALDSRVGAATAAQAAQIGRFDAGLMTPRRGRSGAGAATAAQAAQLSQIAATLRPPNRGRAAPVAAAACQAVQLGRFQSTATHRRMR